MCKSLQLHPCEGFTNLDVVGEILSLFFFMHFLTLFVKAKVNESLLKLYSDIVV